MPHSESVVSLVNMEMLAAIVPRMPPLPPRSSTSSVDASGFRSCSVSLSGGPVFAIVGISDLVSDVLQHPFD